MKNNTWKKMVLAGAGLTLAGSALVACSNNSSTKSSSASDSKTIKLWVPLVLKNLTLLLLKISKKNLATPLRWLNQTIQKAQENVKKRPAKSC